MIYRNCMVRFLIQILIFTITVQTNPLLAHSLSDLPKHSYLRPTSFTNEITELLHNYLPVLQKAVQTLRRTEAVVFNATGQMEDLNGQIKGLELQAERLTKQHNIAEIKKKQTVPLRKMNRLQGALENLREKREEAEEEAEHKINHLVATKEQLIAHAIGYGETRQQKRERKEKIRKLEEDIGDLRRDLSSLGKTEKKIENNLANITENIEVRIVLAFDKIQKQLVKLRGEMAELGQKRQDAFATIGQASQIVFSDKARALRRFLSAPPIDRETVLSCYKQLKEAESLDLLACFCITHNPALSEAIPPHDRTEIEHGLAGLIRNRSKHEQLKDIVVEDLKFLTELTENGLFIPQDKGNHLLETTASDLHASCFAPSPSREELASADWKRDINGYRLGFLATVLGRDVPPGVRSELESVLEKVYVTCLKYSESWDIKDEFYVNADAIMLSLKLYFKAVSNFKAASNQETVTRIACSLARKIIGPDGQISISDGSMRKTALELLNEAKKILPENARIQYAGTDINVASLVDKAVSALEGRIVQRGSAAQEAIDSDA